jgi:hypothetical protein
MNALQLELVTSHAHEFQLEKMIDESTLPDVLEVLADICEEKSAHILASYDDKNLAAFWAARAYLIRTCAGDCS